MTGSPTRSRSLLRRSSRTVPATIVSVVVLAVGVVAVGSAVYRLVNGTWPTQVTGPAAAVGGATWNSPVVVAVGALTAVVGLVLLICGVSPGAHRTAALAVPAGDSGAVEETECVISSRALARLAAAHADTVDGVDSVSAAASGRTVRLRVTTASEQTADIRARVDERVGRALASAGVSPAPRVTTTVRTKEI